MKGFLKVLRKIITSILILLGALVILVLLLPWSIVLAPLALFAVWCVVVYDLML